MSLPVARNTNEPWHASIITLFPEIFPGPLAHSLAGKAKDELWRLSCVDMKQYADRHGRVDGTPCGGGPGMIIRADVVDAALRGFAEVNDNRPRIMLSPRGRVFNQSVAQEWSSQSGIILICGRYEGIDQRVIDKYDLDEISIGDFVLAGGETAACVILDACIRLLPGVVKTRASVEEESFADGLLEEPQYTRPAVWEDRAVPPILLSGHHQEIQQWRLRERQALTKARRKDLWDKYCQTCL